MELVPALSITIPSAYTSDNGYPVMAEVILYDDVIQIHCGLMGGTKFKLEALKEAIEILEQHRDSV